MHVLFQYDGCRKALEQTGAIRCVVDSILETGEIVFLEKFLMGVILKKLGSIYQGYLGDGMPQGNDRHGRLAFEIAPRHEPR